VLLSSSAAPGGDLSNAVARYHILSEAAVRDAGIPWTFLQPNSFMTNTFQWLPQLRAGDVVRAPFPDVRVATIDPEDLGAVAAAALTTGGHEGRAYRLSGPESLLPADRVAVLAKVLGRALRFEGQSDTEARAEMTRTTPPEYVDAFFSFFADGTLDESKVLSTVEEITGRPPRTSSSGSCGTSRPFSDDAAASAGTGRGRAMAAGVWWACCRSPTEPIPPVLRRDWLDPDRESWAIPQHPLRRPARRQRHRRLGRLQGRQLRQRPRRVVQRALQVGAHLGAAARATEPGDRQAAGGYAGHPSSATSATCSASSRWPSALRPSPGRGSWDCCPRRRPVASCHHLGAAARAARCRKIPSRSHRRVMPRPRASSRIQA
jgi:hypothetical protein